jgi:hypothetical protein
VKQHGFPLRSDSLQDHRFSTVELDKHHFITTTEHGKYGLGYFDKDSGQHESTDLAVTDHLHELLPYLDKHLPKKAPKLAKGLTYNDLRKADGADTVELHHPQVEIRVGDRVLHEGKEHRVTFKHSSVKGHEVHLTPSGEKKAIKVMLHEHKAFLHKPSQVIMLRKII